MTLLTVTTQEEMDAAIADTSITYDTHEIEVRSTELITVDTDRPLDIIAYGSSTVRAYGSSTVIAYGSSTVRAYDSSTVRAYDSSTVTAYGSSTVRAYDSSTVRAYDSSTVTAYDSSTVRAYDSSTVIAYDSSTVRAYDSSTVTAYDSSTVIAYGSSTVTAYGSSTVRAYDSSTVRAYDSSTVEATPRVAIHQCTTQAAISGGVVIDHTTTDDATPAGWAAENGATVSDGMVTLYKALPVNLTSGKVYGRETVWAVGEEVTCDDWRADDTCGGGLHLSPTPGHAWRYLDDEPRPRFLECVAPLDSIIPIRGGCAKCKVPRVRVIREVDVSMRPINGEEN